MNITLADGSTNTLNSAVNYAGMQKLSSANSTIACEHASESDHSCDETTCGTLTATGGYGGAGIGGGERGVGSGVIISGGTVFANSHYKTAAKAGDGTTPVYNARLPLSKALEDLSAITFFSNDTPFSYNLNGAKSINISGSEVLSVFLPAGKASTEYDEIHIRQRWIRTLLVGLR